jgi:hypothetical protein
MLPGSDLDPILIHAADAGDEDAYVGGPGVAAQFAGEVAQQVGAAYPMSAHRPAQAAETGRLPCSMVGGFAIPGVVIIALTPLIVSRHTIWPTSSTTLPV